MDEVTPEVEVIRVTESGKVQGVPWFTVETRMYVPAQKYSKGHYRVKLLEPIALADEYLMEDGNSLSTPWRTFKKSEGSKFLFLLLLRVASRWCQETALNLVRIAETGYFIVNLARLATDGSLEDR